MKDIFALFYYMCWSLTRQITVSLNDEYLIFYVKAVY